MPFSMLFIISKKKIFHYILSVVICDSLCAWHTPWNVFHSIWHIYGLSFYGYRLLNHTGNVCLGFLQLIQRPKHHLWGGKKRTPSTRNNWCTSAYLRTASLDDRLQPHPLPHSSQWTETQRTWGYSMSMGNYFSLWKLWLVM